jgi:hypothetical protein
MPADSVLAKAPYKIPTVVDADRICISVPCPNDPDHIANFLEALATLGLWSNYRLEADRLAKPVADVWEDIFRTVEESLCDCALRNGPGGIEQFNNNTGLWTPVQGNSAQGDPRSTGTVPPPWTSPPVGQDGNCLAAANITGVFQSMMLDTISKLGDLAGFASMLVAFEAFLALALPLIGEVIVLATDMAAGAIDAGAVVMAEVFTGDPTIPTYHKLQCVISCHIGTDGTVTQLEIDSIKTEFGDYVTANLDAGPAALWILFVNDFLDSQGKNGLMKLGKASNIVSADCSDCGCGWCFAYDFTQDDAGFTAPFDSLSQTAYVASTGWRSVGTPRVDCYIDKSSIPCPAGTRIEAFFTIDGAQNVSYQLSTFLSGVHQETQSVSGSRPAKMDLTSSTDFDEILIDLQPGYVVNGNVSSTCTKVVFSKASGTNPFGANNC